MQQEKNNADNINLALQSRVEDLLSTLGFDLETYLVTDAEIRGVGLCHSGADNPTGFVYYYDSGIWKCWTNQCHEKYGCDLLGLIRSIKHISFVDAISFAMQFLDNKINNTENKIRSANNIFKRYQNHWQMHLNQKTYDESILNKLSPAPQYAIKRGLSQQIFQELSIGYAKNGSLKYRIVLPVRNWNNKIVGFTGRKLYDEQMRPKWKHFGFNTNINLWNIERASENIAQNHIAILCEGPFDVIKFRMAGFENALALFGTEIHAGQIELLLKCNTMKIILALDNDSAAEKGIKKGRKKLERKLFDVKIAIPPIDGVDFGEMSVEDVQKYMENII